MPTMLRGAAISFPMLGGLTLDFPASFTLFGHEFYLYGVVMAIAFIAAVFGGIGSIQGAVVGGLILGFIEIMTVAFLPSLSGYRDAFAFVLLVVILLVKPTGLFGEKQEEKI